MDTLNHYRHLIQKILTEQTKIPYAHGEIQFETVFDLKSDRYLLLILGRDHEQRRVHGCLVHIDLIKDKFWIQRDGTEKGIANELISVGVPKSQIVLGFRSLEMRRVSEFAVT
ncbi:MAG: XisI protein [Gammaproteobacteria bacterium]|nr:MAG: XisI protein [Gammaproteobacteria bacterium]RKZ45152.1 MAG: XisI protein [Gammaproteobacteria bacterium]RKZ75495.1 MAG: XisI protein [Gammaproteobacteria bacterium]